MRALAAILVLSFGASAAPFGWTGAAGGGHWADGGNWSGGRAPPDDGTADVTFTAGGTVQLDGVRVVSTLGVSSSANVTLQAGAEPRSALVLRGAGLSRAARGRLTFQVPVLAAGAVALSGFESQSTVANATVFDLKTGLWPGTTTVSQATLTASGDALTPATHLALAAGAVLDTKGRPVSVGSLAGGGTVINTSGSKATLFVGFDDTDSTFSGNLGTVLSDQSTNGFVDLVKVGSGTLTVSGTLNLGPVGYGLLRVVEGTLVVTGSVGGSNQYTVIEATSTGHGTLAGTGNAGPLYAASNSVPGATVSPGLPGSHGVLHASSCDLRHATLAIRFSAYATPGVDYDQLACGNGSLTFDSESDLVLDLGGLTATPSNVPIARYGSGNGPAALAATQIRLINNPAGLVSTVTSGTTSLTLTLRNPTAATTPLFVVTPAHGIVTSERGLAASFTIALGKAPSANVSLPVASSDTGEGQVSPASLTFTPQNWSVPQAVTVTGVDDSAPDGNVAYRINLGPCVSTDAAFSNKSPAAVTAINLDDDLITVSPVAGLVTQPLAGPSVTFTFHAPVTGTQDILLQLRSSDSSVGWPSPPMMRVTASNATPPPQTTVLVGAHQLQGTCASYSIVPYSVLSGDALYHGFELPPLAVCNQGNRSPVASDLALVSDQGTSVTLPAPGLWSHAFDPDGDPLTLSIASLPAHGSAVLNADGSVTYVPAAGFSGADSFTYAADDSVSRAIGTVQVTVGIPTPEAVADAYSLDGSAAFAVAAPGVLGNDVAAAGDPLFAELVQVPAHGSVALLSDGSFTYTAAAGYAGLDSFMYRVTDGVRTSAPMQVTLTVMQAGEAADLALATDGGTTPGAGLTLHATVTNLGSVPLHGARLMLSPQGLLIVGASGPAGALTTDAGAVPVPDLDVGANVRIDVEGQLSAGPGERAGATVQLQAGSGLDLGPAQAAWVQVDHLRFDAGGCGCRSSNPGTALAWIGAALLFLRPRRRSALPGRADLHLRQRAVPRDHGLGRLAPADRVDGHHRDLLPSILQPDLGVELARGSDLDRMSLHVDAAPRDHAAGDRDRAAVGLVPGPLHREEHAPQRRGGLPDVARALDPRDLALLHVHGLAAASYLYGAAGGGDGHVAALCGEEEVTPGALGQRSPFDLQRDAALSLLDVGLDAAADAGPEQARRGGAQADLGAVVQLDANAVDRDLRLRVVGRAHRVGGAEAGALGGGLPGLAAALQLDPAAAADQDGRALRRGWRGLGAGGWRRGRSFLLAPARLRAHGNGQAQCCTRAHPDSYRGAGGCDAMPPGRGR